MSTPVPPLVPTAPMPLATDSDAAFDAKAFPALASLNPFGVSLEAIAAATVTNADAALAAALGGSLPPITGQALKLLRVNAGETAAEFVTVAGAVSDVKASTAEAQAGTGVGLMDPVLTKAAIDAQFSTIEQQVGVGQTWQAVTRAQNTSYQNTTGKPIQVSITADGQASSNFEVSVDNSVWFSVSGIPAASGDSGVVNPIVPPGYYYRLTTVDSLILWTELR